MIENIIFSKIIVDDYEKLTDIMTRAFNEDTSMHTKLKEDGPKGYNDGSLIKKLNENIKNTSMEILYKNEVVGAYTIYEEDNEIFYLDMLFIDPNYKNKSLGKLTWQHVEETYRTAKKWSVETPEYSKRNHYFYSEKCSFILTGEKTYGDGEKSYVFEKQF
ncbi:GNAT family N-acetyltransferase [Clostridium gasigenes]|uniref:GNAT family N-acetyltransferase n=1 Tax=Clostridium gasigenes TaxID=94869 RepID=UPI00143861FA|nr:GNAT family N-acetyltransferase [Clostridium gasigenes]MBU3131338.1 GNAT family N-acetyltransferase [Clostridium gasigenes]NKF08450.1 GNAT family N-acetyltransferase [Clostridium gasigenes]QSW18586.1 GNAT family N-acetyltransferase [Clostridium gasigenes]